MAVRYLTYENAIQAAGAAFACDQDDLSAAGNKPARRGKAALKTCALAIAFLLL